MTIKQESLIEAHMQAVLREHDLILTVHGSEAGVADCTAHARDLAQA